MWAMVKSYNGAMETRSWDECPAMILETEIRERQIGEHVPVDYAAGVLFGYEYDGQRYTSELLSRRGLKWAKERKKAEEAMADFTAGEWTTCWVNPQEPTVAILKHDTKAALYTIWFPALFFVGGIGVLYGAYKR